MATVITVNSSKTYKASGKGNMFRFKGTEYNAVLAGTSVKDTLDFSKYIDDSYGIGNFSQLGNDLKFNLLRFEDDFGEGGDVIGTVTIKDYFASSNRITKLLYYDYDQFYMQKYSPDMARTMNLVAGANGGDGEDYIFVFGKNTKLKGGAGNDILYGSSGNDNLYGEGGSDYLAGGTGDDYLYGGDGDDSLNGYSGNDILYGGAGDDSYYCIGASNTIMDYEKYEQINVGFFELYSTSKATNGDVFLYCRNTDNANDVAEQTIHIIGDTADLSNILFYSDKQGGINVADFL